MEPCVIPVTAETVRAVYVMLTAFPPFSRWSMPAADKLNFAVEPLVSRWGDFDPRSMTLRISSARVSTYQSLLLAVCHEAVHVRQDMIHWPAKDPHNALFKKLASQVCKAFELDPANF